MPSSRYSLWAPILDDRREHDLFGVIGNEREKIVDDAPEMSVRTSVDNRCRHTMVKWCENSRE